MIGGSVRFSFLAELVWKGNRVRVQLKTMLRISHHCGFAGISTTMIPGFIASRILKRNMNVAVRFNFESKYAARESEPFVFSAGTLWLLS
jgi:hypothetical protein